MIYLSFLVALCACVVGSICGMGGGVIIKPVLDAIGVMDGVSINFLSGCTVVGMTLWNVGKTLLKKESVIDLRTSTLLGIGAAIGGILGKTLYSSIVSSLPNPRLASGVQAIVLLIATTVTLLYTLNKSKIRSRNVQNPAAIAVIGLCLGLLGAFLGIGGGPFNVAALYLFFSMPTKKATQNSLYIILISQAVSLGMTIVRGATPSVMWWLLAGMVLCGVIGSEIGRQVHRRLNERGATLLFEGSMVLVMCINVYNIIKFFLL